MAEYPHAPEAVWARYAPMVRRIVRRTLGAEHDVEDVVQEIFVRVLQQLPALRDPDAIGAFVIAIAVRAAQYHVRRTRWSRQQGGVDGVDLPERADCRADVESQYAWIRFGRVLERIRERDRAVLVLRLVEGRRLQDIARLLGTSKPTVQRCLARARARVLFFAERDAFLSDYTTGAGQPSVGTEAQRVWSASQATCGRGLTARSPRRRTVPWNEANVAAEPE